jgi:hypothetical protein
MVCPDCKASYDQRLQCPTCNVRLVYKPGGPAPQKVNPNEPTAKWLQSALGRLVVGIVLAQGLYLGLHKLITAGFLATEDSDVRGLWSTLFGVILIQGMQALALLIGGTLAGAGYRRGTLLGIIVGLASGAISLFLQSGLDQDAAAVTLYGQPLLQAALGALGGFIGCTIWKPIPPPKRPSDAQLILKKPAASMTPSLPAKFSGPISWMRVLAGSALAIAGIFYAKTLLKMVVDASDGKLAVDTYLQAELVTWEIKALATLVGSAVAGSGSANGLKQGLCVGLCVGIVQVGIFFGAGVGTLELAILTVTGGLALSLVGGWFGGQLFPAYAGRKARSKLDTAAA